MCNGDGNSNGNGQEVGNLPLEEVGMVEVMVMVMVTEMEEVTLLHPLTQDSHDTANAEEIDGFM